MNRTICLAEDRESCEPALKLIMLSLKAHCPGIPVNVYYPPANDALRDWVQKQCPDVVIRQTIPGGYGWNVKPLAMMDLLDHGFEEVIWIDSDILVTQNIFEIFSHLANGTIAVSEHTLGAKERNDTDAFRARCWGLPVGRVLPAAISSGVVRATRDHYKLLQRWWELLQAEEYQEFQRKDWSERPFHMLGDQDVLTALLTSSEFSQIPVFVLRRGKHIIQFDGVWGYTVAERLRNLMGDGPAFIHSGAAKPWSDRWLRPASLRQYIKMMYLDVSPYTLAAVRYKGDLDCSTEWMQPHYALTRMLRTVGLGIPSLSGLPMAIVLDLMRIPKILKTQEVLPPSPQIPSSKTGEDTNKGKNPAKYTRSPT